MAVCWENITHWILEVNLLHLIIRIHILYVVLHTFSKMLTRRICLTIKMFLMLNSGVILQEKIRFLSYLEVEGKRLTDQGKT